MRILSLLLALSAATFSYGQDKVYLSEDFNNGIPSSFKIVDSDENPLMTTLYKNAATGNGWTANAIDTKDNKAAFSFTHGTYDYPQENWLITPQISLDKDKEAYLQWKAKSVYIDYLESYKIMVSTTDNDISSFKEIYDINGESYFWKDHTLSLKDFKGENIYVAFVSTSTNKYILAIDDLIVSEKSDYEFDVKNTSSRFGDNSGTATVSGTIRNIGHEADIKKISISYGSKRKDIDLDGGSIAPEQAVSYLFNIETNPDAINRYSLSVQMNDGTTVDDIYTDSIITSYFKRKILLEEITGSWCNYCPNGTLYLNKVKETMGNDLIVVSPHISPDPLVCPEYSNGITRWLSSLPTAIYNRNSDYKVSDMYYTQGILETVMTQPTMAMIEAEAINNEGVIEVNAKAIFATDYENSEDCYRIGVAVIANEYTGNEKQGQKNNLTLVSSDEYYYLPQTIPSDIIKYHDVPIEAGLAFTGQANSFPEKIVANTPYDVACKIAYPEKAMNCDSIFIVATVINTVTGEVLNANTAEIYTPTYMSNLSGNDNTSAIKIKKNGNGTITITSDKDNIGRIRIISLDGRTVANSAPVSSGHITIGCSSLRGCYIVDVENGNTRTTNKIVF